MATGGAARRLRADWSRPQGFHQHVMDDLHHHLAGLDRLDDLGAHGAFLHLVDEGADHFEGHVGLKQGAAHFAHGHIDIGLRQRTTAGELVENA